MSDRRQKTLGPPEKVERRSGSPRRRELSRALGASVLQYEEARVELERLENEKRILEEERYTDSLTGLYNERAFNEKLPELMDIAKKNNEPLSLLAVDGNGLHNLNRLEGRAAGDELLKTIATTLQEISRVKRDTDMVVRISGDEFFVILTGYKPMPGVSEEELDEDTIAKYKEALGNNATVGLAVLAPGDSPEELTARADAAYRANKPAIDSRTGTEIVTPS